MRGRRLEQENGGGPAKTQNLKKEGTALKGVDPGNSETREEGRTRQGQQGGGRGEESGGGDSGKEEPEKRAEPGRRGEEKKGEGNQGKKWKREYYVSNKQPYTVAPTIPKFPEGTLMISRVNITLKGDKWTLSSPSNGIETVA